MDQQNNLWRVESMRHQTQHSCSQCVMKRRRVCDGMKSRTFILISQCFTPLVVREKTVQRHQTQITGSETRTWTHLRFGTEEYAPWTAQIQPVRGWWDQTNLESIQNGALNLTELISSHSLTLKSQLKICFFAFNLKLNWTWNWP